MAGKTISPRTRLKDVAEIAGVSVTTVSLVLKDPDTSRVGKQTSKRVLKIVKELNYRPNYSARSLVTSESYTVGLVITTLKNPYYAEASHYIINRARDIGYSVILSAAPGGIEDERKSVNDLLDRGVDGLILSSVMRVDPVVDELIAAKVPFITMSRSVANGPSNPPIDFVGVDNDRGAFIALDHLIRLGHERIAILTGDLNTSTGYKRLYGAQEALKAHGIEGGAELILNGGDFYRQTGYRLTEKLLKLRPRPTAVFAHSDHMAMGVLECLSDRRIKVPQKMAVVGFDNIEMAGLQSVNLTTISQNKSTLGRLAMDLLVEKIQAKTESVANSVLLEPVLKIRKTCGALQR
jgi:LacI family transcriptional regulator